MYYRWMKYWLGLIIMGMGVSLVVSANLGTDPISTIILGVANAGGLSFGIASQILLIIVVAIVYFIDKSRLKVGTLVHAIASGSIIGLCLKLQITTEHLPIRISLLVSGAIVLSVGIAIYISSSLGEGAFDALMMGVHNRFGLNVGVVRVFQDVVLTAIGFILGAKVGVGSIFMVLVTGHMIGFALNGISVIENRKKKTAGFAG